MKNILELYSCHVYIAFCYFIPIYSTLEAINNEDLQFF